MNTNKLTIVHRHFSGEESFDTGPMGGVNTSEEGAKL
jgi:hypothetical protein